MATTCTVTGNLQDLSSATNQGYVLFDLANFGDSVPRVIGTANIVSRKILVQASSLGAISTTLWGNDNIDPAGTLYDVSILDSTKVVAATYRFNITGTSFDLNSATPTPVPPTPTTQNYVVVDVTSAAVGNFTQAHSLGKLPTFAFVAMKTGGFIYFQSTKFDATNLNLTASDVGAAASIFVW